MWISNFMAHAVAVFCQLTLLKLRQWTSNCNASYSTLQKTRAVTANFSKISTQFEKSRLIISCIIDSTPRKNLPMLHQITNVCELIHCWVVGIEFRRVVPCSKFNFKSFPFSVWNFRSNFHALLHKKSWLEEVRCFGLLENTNDTITQWKIEAKVYAIKDYFDCELSSFNKKIDTISEKVNTVF